MDKKNLRVDDGRGVTEGTDDVVENKPARKQLIPEEGEEYLREAGKIEDYPSPAEDAEAENTLREEPDNGMLRK
ncbi:MAG TPA: hypothetical protein VEB42_11830 [Chitinophagaceae bacterium]|nr:hypothetical protein [Chitinophagaceae bacterium]